MGDWIHITISHFQQFKVLHSFDFVATQTLYIFVPSSTFITSVTFSKTFIDSFWWFSYALRILVPHQSRLCFQLNSKTYSEQSRNNSKVSALNYFNKELHLRCLTVFLIASEILFHIAYCNPIIELLFLIFSKSTLLKY